LPKKYDPHVGAPKIIVLYGLRRLGKTTLMLKIVEDSIVDGLGKSIKISV